MRSRPRALPQLDDGGLAVLEATRAKLKAQRKQLDVELGTVNARIAAARAQQRERFVRAVANAIGLQIAFSANELRRHTLVSPELRLAFDQAAIISVESLGKRLQSLEGRAWGGFRIVRVGHDKTGVIWAVMIDETDAHHHRPSCPMGPSRA